MPLADLFNSAVNAVKSLDTAKIKRGLDNVQNGVEMASAAFDKPEIALAGLLKTFANRAMGKQLDTQDAKDIARMTIKAIGRAK